jgi:hypothetical protein
MANVETSKVTGPIHSYYADFNKRLKSYQLIRPPNKINLPEKDLATAGFFYEG